MGIFWKKKNVELKSPLTGSIIPTNKIKDATFAECMLGETIGIVPTKDVVKSPIDGKVTAFYPTGHAFNVEHKKGFNVLVHVGINTVEINKDVKAGGKLIAFTPLVKVDDTVTAGQDVLKINIKKITELGYDVTTSVILISETEYKLNFDFKSTKKVTAGDVVCEICK